MSNLSINTEQKYLLNGVEYNAPIEWEDVEIAADYSGDNVQPSLTIEEFQFTLEAKQVILNWIQNGMTGGVGIFEGMPFQLTLFNNQAVQHNFKAFLDFTNGLVDLTEDGRLDVSIIPDNGLENFFSQIESTTFGYLEQLGVVNSSDYLTIDYVVEKKFNMMELLISSVVLYLMIKELAESIYRTAELIATVYSYAAILFGYGTVSSIIYVIAYVLIQVAYTAALLVAVIDLSKKMMNTLNPPKRQHKVILWKRAMEIVCNFYGYNLISPIAELNFIHYLPSNPRLDTKLSSGFINQTKGTLTGIPNTLDYGYNCAEMFDLAKTTFNGKFAIIGNDVHFRPENDPFWLQISTYTLPDVLIEKIQWNTEEMKAERLILFDVDLNDDWTIDNYFGNAFEIRTEPNSVIRKQAVLLKGIDEVKIRTALPTRKNELNAVEEFLSFVAGFIDGLTGILGGGTNFQGQLQSKVGILKQSENWHSVPKLLFLLGGKLPVNHRDFFNARTLYFNYHKEKSFVLDNYHGQKIVYNDIEVPFGFEDYKKLTTNSYFYYNGSQAKIIRFAWSVGQDTAKLSFWVRQPYTKNLQEIYIEPS